MWICWCCFVFSFPQSWFLWQGLSESRAKKCVTKIGNLEKQTHHRWLSTDCWHLKVFLSRQHYSKYYYRTQNPYTPPQEDSQSNTIWTGTFVAPPPLCAGGFNEIEWTDSKRKEEEEEDEKLSHTHHDMSERKHNMATWQMTNYAFVVSLFYDFSFFFHFVVSTMKLHALAGRSKTNKQNK